MPSQSLLYRVRWLKRFSGGNRDLASQLRRAVSSIVLNTAEGLGNNAGNARFRFESARGSLNEAQAGIRVAIAWGYVSQAAAGEVLESMHQVGGQVYGSMRRQVRSCTTTAIPGKRCA